MKRGVDETFSQVPQLEDRIQRHRKIQVVSVLWFVLKGISYRVILWLIFIRILFLVFVRTKRCLSVSTERLLVRNDYLQVVYFPYQYHRSQRYVLPSIFDSHIILLLRYWTSSRGRGEPRFSVPKDNEPYRTDFNLSEVVNLFRPHYYNRLQNGTDRVH